MGNRIDHMMARTIDIDWSIEFYTTVLGMNLLNLDDRRGDETNRYIAAYLGYSEEVKLEIVYNIEQEEELDIGNVVGHVAIYTDDSDAIVNVLDLYKIEFKEFEHTHNNIKRRMITFKSPEGFDIVVSHKGY